MSFYCSNPACFQYVPCANHTVDIHVLDAEIMSAIASFLYHDMQQWNYLRSVCNAWKDMSLVWLEHVDFVICKYDSQLPALAKLVGLRHISLCSRQDDWVPQISALTSLTNLYTTCITDVGIGTLCCFPLLDTLGSVSITDAYVDNLSSLKSLKRLLVERSDINGESLSVLTQVDYLSLRECKNLTQLSCLAPLTGLRTLMLDNFEGEDMEPLSHLVSLEYLSLPDTQTNDMSLEYFRPLSVLRVLALGGTLVSDEGLVTIGSFSSLQELNLWDCPITMSGVSLLRSLKLTRLNLNGIIASDDQAIATGLVLLTSLTQLDLASTDMLNAGLILISVLTDLRWLNLGDNSEITDEGLQSTTALKSLTHLDLTGTAITDAGVCLLTSLSQLRELDLTSCQVTNLCLPSLVSFRNLDHLMMSRTLISNESLVCLASLITLKYLSVTHCPNISSEGLLVLSSLTRLKRLFLILDQISTDVLQTLKLTMGRTELANWF